MPSHLSQFASSLVACCPGIRSIWMVETDREGHVELVVFANGRTLEHLRKAEYLYRDDVDVLVVTEGDRFESAWGKRRRTGTLLNWDRRHTGPGEAYYDMARWAGQDQDGLVERVRCKALLLWGDRAKDAHLAEI
jgi:hypothetical protein